MCPTKNQSVGWMKTVDLCMCVYLFVCICLCVCVCVCVCLCVGCQRVGGKTELTGEEAMMASPAKTLLNVSLQMDPVTGPVPCRLHLSQLENKD